VAAVASRVDVAVDSLDVAAYTIPTEAPESDGTLEWDSTTIVVGQAHARDETGLGYTYVDLVTQAPGLVALVKRAAGMAPARELPTFAPLTLQTRFRARGERNPGGPKVILWLDTFNNCCATRSARGRLWSGWSRAASRSSRTSCGS
jgi:hypothetical protein